MIEYEEIKQSMSLKNNELNEIYIMKQFDKSDTPGDVPSIESESIQLQMKPTIARKRWKILAKAIKKNCNTNSNGGKHKSNGNNWEMCDGDWSNDRINKTNRLTNSSSSSSSNSSTSSSSSNSNSTSKDIADDLSDDLLASVRRFGSFDLIQQDHISQRQRDELLGYVNDWFEYKLNINNFKYSVNIHHVNRTITALDLMGFNNTGNICVWPSEEALAYFALTDINSFNNKWVLELGGGMTCLAGLLIAKYGRPHCVHLTDGNIMSIDNVKKTCRLNDINNCYIKCSVLQWEKHSENNDVDDDDEEDDDGDDDDDDNVDEDEDDIEDADYNDNNLHHITTTSNMNTNNNNNEKFDYILSADCLFFDDARDALVDTIWYYLSDTGICFVMAPRRGNTLDEFVKRAQLKGFKCQILKNYNDLIWKRHEQLMATTRTYDENIHYPILIKMTK